MLGTLQVGAPGDIANMELVEGSVSFVDTSNNKREGKAHLKRVHILFGRPYTWPFAVR
jgi:dihydroorotase